mmetsp:Transcript_34888/g.90389  ORF Transcript_34888/g.90389 Transcript_34888/m.90389 type:complete len:113 (-) Transcript_34888:988-1326(-)|eukprot:CAMPEP_0113894102 /NCGR_PEP_ID=MMETSP0780_2-20120614/16499_1 /TAXON_ID=652834 /ORGANISM="Palpitomonas bilix" /LENGTH=112 /DNA_ID=CAMNT_0000884541 /DNA_START=372 /DNA_END=710 /DNA_ORIENTATION=+ /assembly_acc=CAM_ASM_000599
MAALAKVVKRKSKANLEVGDPSVYGSGEDPIVFYVGGLEYVFTDGKWTTDRQKYDEASEVNRLEAENETLKGEIRLLEYKCDLLTDKLVETSLNLEKKWEKFEESVDRHIDE